MRKQIKLTAAARNQTVASHADAVDRPHIVTSRRHGRPITWRDVTPKQSANHVTVTANEPQTSPNNNARPQINMLRVDHPSSAFMKQRLLRRASYGQTLRQRFESAAHASTSALAHKATGDCERTGAIEMT